MTKIRFGINPLFNMKNLQPNKIAFFINKVHLKPRTQFITRNSIIIKQGTNINPNMLKKMSCPENFGT